MLTVCGQGEFQKFGGIYLVTVVVHQRQPVFTDWRLGRRVVEQFRLAQEDDWANSLAWVVMPDHFHWLLQLRERTLAELMCRVKSRSSLTVNQTMGRRGRLWQKGYHDRAARQDEDVKNIARYVVCNPCEQAWSSVFTIIHFGMPAGSDTGGGWFYDRCARARTGPDAGFASCYEKRVMPELRSSCRRLRSSAQRSQIGAADWL